MAIQYFDKDVKEITENLYKDLVADDSYRTVHAFQNEKVKLIIEWVGAIEGADQLFRTTYPLFVAKQFDFLPDKDEWIESFESNRTFPNMKKVSQYYEDFVMRWTESYIDEEGEIHEVGNVLAPPPPPPSEDAPQGTYDEMVW